MKTSLQQLLRDPLSLAGLVLLTIMGLLAVLSPVLSAHDPTAVDMTQRLLPPSFSYLLGTDWLGRCVWSRLLAGARITLGTAAAATGVALAVGVPLGLIAGYARGQLDALIMRTVDAVLAFPDVLLAITLAGLLGPGLQNVTLAIVLVKWAGYARLVRGIVLTEGQKEYVLAAQVAGSRPGAILLRHLVPHVLPHILVLATLDFGKVILTVSALSYIGLGAAPPAPEWGALLSDARPYLQILPSLLIYPGMAIFLAVLGTNLLGDGLRDVLDIRQHKS